MKRPQLPARLRKPDPNPYERFVKAVAAIDLDSVHNEDVAYEVLEYVIRDARSLNQRGF